MKHFLGGWRCGKENSTFLRSIPQPYLSLAVVPGHILAVRCKEITAVCSPATHPLLRAHFQTQTMSQKSTQSAWLPVTRVCKEWRAAYLRGSLSSGVKAWVDGITLVVSAKKSLRIPLDSKRRNFQECGRMNGKFISLPSTKPSLRTLQAVCKT